MQSIQELQAKQNAWLQNQATARGAEGQLATSFDAPKELQTALQLLEATDPNAKKGSPGPLNFQAANPQPQQAQHPLVSKIQHALSFVYEKTREQPHQQIFSLSLVETPLRLLCLLR